MNKIYRLVWNSALQLWVAVSELAKAQGKGKKGRKQLTATGLAGALFLSLVPAESAFAYSGDDGDDSADTQYGIAIGKSSKIGAEVLTVPDATQTGNTDLNGQRLNNIAIGESAKASLGSVAMGDHADAFASTGGGGNTAIGVYSKASRYSGSTAIGTATLADGQNSTAVGWSAMTSGFGDIAIGDQAIAGDHSKLTGNSEAETGAQNSALGHKAKATGGHSVALGAMSVADGYQGTALGANSHAVGKSSVAMGANATANNENDIALGAGSSTAASVATTGISINGANYTFAGTAPTSTVSIGSTGNERTLTNLAAGRISASSTDAVNGSQLHATNQALESISTSTQSLDNFALKYDSDTNGDVDKNNITLGGNTYNNTTKKGGTTITNVAAGVNASDAVNVQQLTDATDAIINTGTKYFHAHSNKADSSAAGIDSIAVGPNAQSKGARSIAIGDESEANANNSIALGGNAKANNASDVALGMGSVTAATVATDQMTINGKKYDFAGSAPVSTVSVGNVGQERTITNVAAGRISATSTDAINGSQLFATTQAMSDISQSIQTLDENAVKYETDPISGLVDKNSITLGGNTYNSTTKDGGTKITNVAYGVDASDAVNVQQLNDTKADIFNNGINYFHAKSTKADSTATGTDSIAVGPAAQSTGDNAIAMGNEAKSTGAGSTAIGLSAQSKGENSVAMGANTVANNAGDVALGAGSVTGVAAATTGVKIRGTDYDFAGTAPTSTVSIGSVGSERTLTNLAAGRISATSTDAVNGSQLYATNQALESMSASTQSLDKFAIKYDSDANGDVNKNSITLGGDSYDSTTKDGGTKITNVAYGVDDSDAVNVQQLNEATANMYTNGIQYFHANSSKADSSATGTDSIAVGPAAQSTGDNAIAMGNEAKATGAGSTAIGQSAQSKGEKSVAMGANAVANNAGDVALGAGSVTETAVATTGVDIRGEHYDFAGTAPTSTVSVGSEGNERTITNLAAGKISADSTDAINGSQLYATNQALEKITSAIGSISESVIQYDTNSSGQSSITLGGDTYDESTHTGGTTITNLADGVAPSDAVNKNQLDQVDSRVTEIREGKAGMFQVNNTSNLAAPSATGKDAIAGGAGASATAENSMAIGSRAKATHTNSVALGANSVTDRENSVSVGYAGGERQITNVAAGTADTDAVNVGQVKQLTNDSKQYTNAKFNDLKNMLDDQGDKMSAGIAGAMAMAGLPQPYAPGASMVGLAGGTYQGEAAVALGISAISDNGKWVGKLSASTNSQSDIGAAIGVGYQW